jgi:hypothetical protein
MAIKTGEQILKERGNMLNMWWECPSFAGLYDSTKCPGKLSDKLKLSECLKCKSDAVAMKYDDQGNGVYVPIEEEG